MIPKIDLSLEDGVSIDETAFLARVVNILIEAVEIAGLKFREDAELSLVLAEDPYDANLYEDD